MSRDFKLRKVRTGSNIGKKKHKYDSGPLADNGNTQREDEILLAVGVEPSKKKFPISYAFHGQHNMNW